MRFTRTNGLFFLLTISILGISFPLSAQDPAIGDWEGRLKTPGKELRIVFHIEEAEKGLRGTMDSPDQHVRGVEFDSVERKGDSLYLRISSAGAEYRGVFQDTDSLEGKWIQRGISYELDLARGVSDSSSEQRRPQTPKPPYPYRSIDTSFLQAPAGFRLAGTLTLPKGEGPFPAIALVSGSGPQDRNETIMGHQPFHVIADHLTRKGVAVLRYDDRGVGASQGNFQNGTIDKFTTDARAAFEFLKGHDKVDSTRVGMLGHSEGGIVVSQLAASEDPPAFLVLMASPALAGDSTLFLQNRALLEAMGMKDTMIEEQLQVLDSLFTYIRTGKDSSFIMERTRDMLSGLHGERLTEKQMELMVQRYESLTSDWFRSFIETDPRKFYRKVEVPVLALFGENDLQVLPEVNEEAMRKAFEKNDEVEIRTIEGVNHLFQPDSVGLPSNYGRIDTTIHPPVLEKVGEWVEKR